MISSGSGALRCARTDLSRPRYGQIYRPVFLRFHCTCTLSLPITQSIANWNYHYRRHYSSTFIACSYIPIMPIGGPQGHIMVIGLNIQLLPLRKKERKKIPTAVCVCVHSKWCRVYRNSHIRPSHRPPPLAVARLLWVLLSTLGSVPAAIRPPIIINFRLYVLKAALQ